MEEPPQTALSQGQDGEPEAAARPWQQLGAPGDTSVPGSPGASLWVAVSGRAPTGLAACTVLSYSLRLPDTWVRPVDILPEVIFKKIKIKISQQLSRNISHLTPQNKNALAFSLFFVKNNKNKTNVLLWEVIFLPPSFTKSSQGQGGKRRVPSPGDLPSPLHAGVSHAWCQGHAYLLTHPEAWAMSAANERGLGNFITTS